MGYKNDPYGVYNDNTLAMTEKEDFGNMFVFGIENSIGFNLWLQIRVHTGVWMSVIDYKKISIRNIE